jgi:hypothetical protein
MDQKKIDAEYQYLKGNLDLDKIEKVARTSRLLSILFIPFLFFLFVYGGYKLNSLRQEVTALDLLKRESIAEREKIQAEIADLEKQKNMLAKEKAAAETDLIKAMGYSPNFDEKEQNDAAKSKAIAANAAIKKMTENNWNREKDIEVYYYNKTIDEKKIVVGLEALGYQFQTAPPSRYMDKKQTNSIWFGSDVPIKDVKVVALALIRAGIQIRAIRPYQRSSTDPDYKSNRIEVGASVDVERRPPLTVDEVVAATEFQR